MRRHILLPAAVLVFAIAASCSAEKRQNPEGIRRVRPAAFAGSWYPGSKSQLERTVDGFIASTKRAEIEGRLYGLIAPHAGYRFSGRVAGWAYRQVKQDKYNRVLLLSPSHGGGFRGFSIMSVDAYSTPLGEIPLGREICDKLSSHKLHVKEDRLHAEEHAIEVHLPFLQRRLGHFKLVPVLVGSLQSGDAAEIGAALKELVSPSTLVLVSSDFTHYGGKYRYLPFMEDLEENIKKLDHGAIDLILSGDFDGYMAYLKKTGATICGRNAIAVFLKMLPADAKGRLLKYDTSGRITRGFRNSVSYASIGFWLPDEGTAQIESVKLTLPEKKTLLQLARKTIDTYVRTRSLPDKAAFEDQITPRLERRGGAFVTLKKHGRLRGCIGRIPRPETLSSLPPLYATVTLMAVQSSTQDRRFKPVSADELKDIEIEISVLSTPKDIDGPDGFEVGSHGIIVRKGSNSAVFLPQIAPEQGWTRDQTLSRLCMKAGLPPDEWTKPGMDFCVFTADVFDESLLGTEEAAAHATIGSPEE